MGKLIYLLDTNILSEPAKAKPNTTVMERLERYEECYCTAATVWHELRFGCEKLPPSKLRRHLESYLRALLDNALVILPFEQKAAEWLAGERARLMRQGYVPAYADSEIAAIAVTNQLVLVTRNSRDFERFDNLRLENWFEQ